jgi:hypothetical protein
MFGPGAPKDANRDAKPRSNRALQRPGACAGLRIERLEGSMSRPFDQTVRLVRSAPAAEGQSR